MFDLIRLMWPDHLNDRSVPDRPFRIQDWIGGRSNELILLSSVRTGELIPKLMSIWRHLSHSTSTLCKEDNLVFHKSTLDIWKISFLPVFLLIIVLNRFGWWVRSQRFCDTYQTVILKGVRIICIICKKKDHHAKPSSLQEGRGIQTSQMQKRSSHQTVIFTRGPGHPA